jgi:hypothetical protein
MHLVMRSTLAVGEWSLRRPENARIVDLLRAELTKRYGIKVYRFSNNGNHLHFLLRGRRRAIQTFLRVFLGRLAALVTGARKALPLGRRFWDLPAWTRIVEWGKSFKVAASYVVKNLLEAEGMIAYEARKVRKRKR